MATIAVNVRKMTGATVGTFSVGVDKPVSALKQDISELGGPPPSDQQLIVGHEVLKDDMLCQEALAGHPEPVVVFLLTVLGCPSCKGPCACSLCGCEPQSGLIDYYGVCKMCSKCGGHSSPCPFCNQSYPSLCALDTHVCYMHPDQYLDGEWQSSRLDGHIRRRFEPGARRAAAPEAGTFMEACRGGLPPAV